MVESGITAIFPSTLEHVADIGRAGRVSEYCLLQILGGQAVANGETKDIDDLVRVRPDKMGTENAPAALFDQGLEAVNRLGATAGRVPVRHLLTLDPEREPRRARRRFARTHGGDRRQGEGYARHAAIVRPVPVAFEKIGR